MLVCAGESIDFGEKKGFDPRAVNRYLADRGGPTRFAEPCAKWCMGVISKPTLASTLHRACQIAMTPPRGPVFVSLPFEFLFEDAAGPIPTSYPRPAMRGADVDLLDQAHTCSRRAVGRSSSPMQRDAISLRSASAYGSPSCWWRRASHPRGSCLRLSARSSSACGVDPCTSGRDATRNAVEAVAPWHPPWPPGKAAKIVALNSNPLRPICRIQVSRRSLLIEIEFAV